jgi:malonyl-CoA/methylmalonyl-CoA synthetase
MANPLFDTLFGRHFGSSAPFLFMKDGSVWTYEDFLNRAAQIAHVIKDAGLVAGDRVAVQVEKSAEALAVYAACAQSGTVFLPLNTAYTKSEVSYFFDDANANLIICRSKDLAAYCELTGASNRVFETLDGDGSGSLLEKADVKSSDFETVSRKPDDLAALLYTSGTTGRSKGAMLSQDNLLSNSQSLVEYWQFTSKDVLLHALPIFHTHGLFVASNVMLLAGGAMIFLPGLDMEQMFTFMPKATSMMGVPTFYTRLLSDERLNKQSVSHMRLFISGSAPLLAETHLEFEARTGQRILERYGMTETNMNTSNPYDGERRAGTVGLALPGVSVRVCNPDNGSELSNGETGVLEVKGRNVFKGYWQMPDKTEEEFRDDGYFITGDLATKDDDGYITIVGRAKDLIISGGYNIYPKEIELVLDELEGVNESAVIGVPHLDFGEGVVAVLVAKKGFVLDIGNIMQAIGEKLAKFKQPKKVIVLDELPRNTMGKVQKNVLRDSYSSIFKS